MRPPIEAILPPVNRDGRAASAAGCGWALAVSLAGLLSPQSATAQLAPGTPPGSLVHPLEPVSACRTCHSGLTTASGESYGAHDTWAPSMLANAARDPLFLATVTVAEQDAPGISARCYRCHSPTAFQNGHAASGMLDRAVGDLDGVHCDTCHRAVPAPRGMAGRNGALYFNDGPEGSAPPRLGPRADAASNTRHTSAESAFVRSSELCGTCHELEHPTRNRRAPTGEDMGYLLPLQTTYSEWLQSDFGRGPSPETCQSCHMPGASSTESLRVARIGAAPNRPGVLRHDLHGANAWGMDLLRAAYPGEADAAFTAARARVEATLRTAARVEITEVPAEAAPGAQVTLRVRVTNLTGHKLPTGYEDARVMWIELRVGDSVVSGAYANDELVEDPQARVYRLQLGRMEGGGPVLNDFVASHEVVMEDTRIPPRGARPEARIAPVGRDYAGGPDGALRHYDEAAYTVRLPTSGATVPITARLMYRSTTRHYIESIAGANRTDARGTELLRLWDASGRAAPLEVARATATVRTGGSDGSDDGGCTARPGAPRAASTGGLLTCVAALAAMRRRRRPQRARV